jgi:alpha-ketoglutarate-dependent taurine dioxygenase
VLFVTAFEKADMMALSRISDHSPPPMLERAIRGRKAWRTSSLRREDWIVPISDACLAEIDALIGVLRLNPVPTVALDITDYSLSACRKMMKRLRTKLDKGVGFAVLDKLPVDSYEKSELTAVYWLLSSMIARPVAQSFGGMLLYDVHDTGKKIATRVRGDLTNQKLAWHTDYGFNHPPPYLGLLVLRTSKSGGESCVISLASVHNEMRRRCPDLLARLYRPYYWNRQGEHPSGDSITNVNPIFRYDGGHLNARVNRRLLQVGHELMNEPMDQEGAEALDALYDIMDDPKMKFTFQLEAGQLQYLHNWRCAHERTGYKDYDAPDKRRHLVRIFLRNEGARSYMG